MPILLQHPVNARQVIRFQLHRSRHVELDADDPDGVYLAETLTCIECEVSAGPAGAPNLVEVYLASPLILLYRLGGGRQRAAGRP